MSYCDYGNSMRFDGDIIITDPCYVVKKNRASTEKWHEAENNWNEKNKDDWEICDYGANMEALGIIHYLCAFTKYGDWNCHTYTDTPEHTVLGQFCADAGLVGVFLLDEVKKYNPDYADVEKSPHAVTLIKDFHGEVSINLVKEEFCVNEEERFNEDWFPEYETKEEVSVVGKGNIDFFTCQTGL